MGERGSVLPWHTIPEFSRNERENRGSEYPMSRRRILEEWNLKDILYTTFSGVSNTKYVFLSCKGKAVPLQAWSGPEGSRKLRFPDYMTTAQDGGKVVSLTHRPPLTPGKAPGTHFC